MIASVLKPVDDVRAFWKFSQSIAKTNKYEVNIIGNRGKKEINEKNITSHSFPVNAGNWISRWIIRERILFKILKLKPDLLVISTHELINIAFIVKLIIRCKVVYDVQENYASNLRYINPNVFRKALASLVQIKEHFSRTFISEYWLAEECYKDELRFVRDRYRIIENKAGYHSPYDVKLNPIKMIFSGTVSTYGGVEKCLKLFYKIHEEEPETTLHIIGQVHDPNLLQWLVHQQSANENIQLTVSEKPVPHDDILFAISKANLGVISYMPNPVNRDKVPTKLYEYSRYRIPYVVQENTRWSEKGEELGGAIPMDFMNIQAQKIIDQHRNSEKLFTDSYPANETWEYESQQLLISIDQLIDQD